MPHAAWWVVQLLRAQGVGERNGVSMPHAALWVVQHLAYLMKEGKIYVSMPHAALWVVQHFERVKEREFDPGFNAARGFVGGAAIGVYAFGVFGGRFNAARGFVGGAAAYVSCLVMRR